MVKTVLDIPPRSKSKDLTKTLTEAAFHVAANGVIKNLSPRISAAAGDRAGEITLTVSGADIEHLSITMSGPEELVKSVKEALASKESA